MLSQGTSVAVRARIWAILGLETVLRVLLRVRTLDYPVFNDISLRVFNMDGGRIG